MKKTLLYVVPALVLVSIALWLIFRDTRSTIDKDLKAFMIEDTARITKIFLADKSGNSSLLVKEAPGRWKVNDKFIARNDLINILLATMKSVEVLAPVAKAAYNQVITDLASRGVKVEVYTKKYFINWFNKIRLFEYESLEKVYYVGGPTMDHSGTYMMLENTERPFITFIQGFNGFLSPRYTPREIDWRDRSIYRYHLDQIASITVEHPDSTAKGYILEYKGGNDFSLKNIATKEVMSNPDTVKILDYFTSFYRISFEDFPKNLTTQQVDSIKKHKPLFIISVTDKEGKKNKVTAWKKANPYGYLNYEGKPEPWDVDRLYASINNDQDFVLIQYFVFDNIIKEFEYFRKIKK